MILNSQIIIFIVIILILLILLLIWIFYPRNTTNTTTTNTAIPSLSERDLVPYCVCQYEDITNSTGNMSLFVKNTENKNCQNVCTESPTVNTRYNYCQNINTNPEQLDLGVTPIDCSSFEIFALPESFKTTNTSTINVNQPQSDLGENWYRQYSTYNVSLLDEVPNNDWNSNFKINTFKSDISSQYKFNNFDLKEVYIFNTDPSQSFSHSYISTSKVAPNPDLNHFGSPKTFYAFQRK